MPTQARSARAKVYISVEKVKLIAFNVDSNSYSFCLFWNNGWCAHHSCRSDVWKLFTFQWPLTACSIVSLNFYLYFSLFSVLFIETNENWTIRAYWSNIRFQIQCVICSNLQKKKYKEAEVLFSNFKMASWFDVPNVFASKHWTLYTQPNRNSTLINVQNGDSLFQFGFNCAANLIEIALFWALFP